MAYQRGSKKSYRMWADLVGDDSYRWDSFLPYFKKSLQFTPPDAAKRAANATAEYDPASLGNSNGPLSVTFSNYAQAIASWVQKGLSEIGIKPIKGFTSGELLGSSYVMQAIQAKTQTRESSETAFLQPALQRTNLIVFSQSLAKKIVFDEKKSATGVLVDTDGKKYTLSAKNEVIVSAGAFRSPQLLMVSGVGPSDVLQRYGIPVVADRAGVGRDMWVSQNPPFYPLDATFTRLTHLGSRILWSKLSCQRCDWLFYGKSKLRRTSKQRLPRKTGWNINELRR